MSSMTGFVVTTTEDEVVVFLVAICKANIVVGLGEIKAEAVFVATLCDPDSNVIGTIVFHLRNNARLLQGHAGGFDCVFASDFLTIKRGHFDLLVEQALFLAGHHSSMSVAGEVGLLGKPFEGSK